MIIARLDYVDITDIWSNQAADFTKWLANNIY